MARLAPVRWSEFVRRMHQLGFEGPFAGGKHPHMMKGVVMLIIPNPNRNEISIALLARLLRQAGISRQEWERSK